MLNQPTKRDFFVFLNPSLALTSLLALSLSACQQPAQLTDVTAVTSSAPLRPSPSAPEPAQSPAGVIPSPKAPAMILRLEVDPDLNGFLTQADSFSLCLGQVQKTRIELRFTGALSPDGEAALKATGASVNITPEGQGLIRLESSLDPGALLKGLEFVFPALPQGLIEGEQIFLDAKAEPLGSVSWRLQPSGSDRVLVQLKPAPSDPSKPAERADCPRLEAQISGAELVGTGEQSALPQVSPTTSPIPSPMPEPSQQAGRPAAPQNVRVVEQTSDSLTLQWEFDMGPLSYNLYLNDQPVKAGHTFPNYYRFEKLNSETSYRLGVSAVNVSGESQITNVNGTTTRFGRSGSGSFSGGSGGGTAPTPEPIVTPVPTPTPVPPNLFEAEQRINTFTAGGQENAAIAINAAGQFVVVWESGAEFVPQIDAPATNTQDGSGKGIFAQRYNAAGQAIGSEIQVNTYTDNDQSLPKVGIDDSGNFTIVWQSRGQSGTPGQINIYARTYDANGLPRGEAFRVDSGNETHNRQKPTVAKLSTGEFIVVWENLFTSNSNLQAQRFDANGAMVGEILSIGSSTRKHLHPRVEANGTQIMVAWNEKNTVNNTNRVLYQLFNFETPTQNSTVSINSLNEAHPVGVKSANGGFIYFYEQGALGNQRIMGRTISSQNVISSAFEALALRNLGAWTAVGQSNGQALLGWQQTDMGQSDVYGRRVSGANQFSEALKLHSYEANQQQNPALALAPDGHFVAIWDGEGETDTSGVYGRGYQTGFAPILTPP